MKRLIVAIILSMSGFVGSDYGHCLEISMSGGMTSVETRKYYWSSEKRTFTYPTIGLTVKRRFQRFSIGGSIDYGTSKEKPGITVGELGNRYSKTVPLQLETLHFTENLLFHWDIGSRVQVSFGGSFGGRYHRTTYQYLSRYTHWRTKEVIVNDYNTKRSKVSLVSGPQLNISIRGAGSQTFNIGASYLYGVFSRSNSYRLSAGIGMKF